MSTRSKRSRSKSSKSRKRSGKSSGSSRKPCGSPDLLDVLLGQWSDKNREQNLPEQALLLRTYQKLYPSLQTASYSPDYMKWMVEANKKFLEDPAHKIWNTQCQFNQLLLGSSSDCVQASEIHFSLFSNESSIKATQMFRHVAQDQRRIYPVLEHTLLSALPRELVQLVASYQCAERLCRRLRSDQVRRTQPAALEVERRQSQPRFLILSRLHRKIAEWGFRARRGNLFATMQDLIHGTDRMRWYSPHAARLPLEEPAALGRRRVDGRVLVSDSVRGYDLDLLLLPHDLALRLGRDTDRGARIQRVTGSRLGAQVKRVVQTLGNLDKLLHAYRVKERAGLAHQSSHLLPLDPGLLFERFRNRRLFRRLFHAFHESFGFDLKHLRPAKDVVLPRLLLQTLFQQRDLLLLCLDAFLQDCDLRLPVHFDAIRGSRSQMHASDGKALGDSKDRLDPRFRRLPNVARQLIADHDVRLCGVLDASAAGTCWRS